MATQTLGSITFLQQRLYGGSNFPPLMPYRIEVFFNDVTNQLVYFANNVPAPFSLFETPLFLSEGNTIYATLDDKSYKYCKPDNSLVSFFANVNTGFDGSQNFTSVTGNYWSSFTQANHHSCNIVVCDIQFAGEPFVTKATGQFNSDGSVTVNANSSNGTITYAIGSLGVSESSVVYQSSNVFNNLVPGSYTVFIKDDEQCKSTKNVTVGYVVEDFLNVRYFGEFVDNHNQGYRLEVKEKTNSGQSNEVCWGDGDTPIKIYFDEDEDLFKKRIKASRARIQLVSKTHFEYLDVFNKPDKFFRAEFYKDPNGVDELVFVGYLVTEQYNEVFKDPPYYSNLLFSDGLGELKSIDFKTDGEDITGVNSDFNVLLTVLRKLNIDANVRIAVNLEINGVTIGAQETPLHKTFNDLEVYKDKSCEDVIKDLMVFYNSRISQENGKYYIIRVPENVRPFDYKEFDLDGNYIGTGTINNYFLIQRPERDLNKKFYADQFPELIQKSAFKSIEITRPSHARDNVLDNGNFQTIENIGTLSQFTQGWEELITNTVSTSLIPSNTIEGSEKKFFVQVEGNTISSNIYTKTYNVSHYKGDTFRFSFRYNSGLSKGVPFVKLKWRVTWGDRYLNSAGQWNKFTSLGPLTVNTIYESSHQTWQSYEITSESPDLYGIGLQGNLKVELFAPDFQLDRIISSFDENNTTGSSEGDQIIVDLQQDNAFYGKRLRFYKNDGNAWRQLGEEWEGRLGIINTVFVDGLGNIDFFDDPYFYFDDVFFNIFPGGEPLEDTINTKVDNGDYFNEYSEQFISGTLPRDLGPLPLAPARSEQDRFLYRYWKRDENGDPLFRYRTIGGNYLQMEKLITAEIREMYKDNYWILRGNYFSKDKINFINAIVDLINPVTDLGGGVLRGKVYLLVGLEWDVKKCLHRFTSHEVTEADVTGEVVTPPDPIETSAFTTGFSLGFES